MRLEQLREVVDVIRPLMGGFAAPWCVAGGWALDLFLGRATRSHSDVELAVFRQDQALLHRHLPGWKFEKIVDGRRQVWNEAEWLDLPVHEIHAHSEEKPPRSVEFLLNERDADNWIFRRSPSIRLPMDRAISPSKAGVPVLSPEVVLLFKAKSPREKDESDFRTACEEMNAQRRRWLHDSIEACHPGHPWLEVLVTSTGGDA